MGIASVEKKLAELLELTLKIAETNDLKNDDKKTLKDVKDYLEAIKLEQLIFNDENLIGQTLRHAYLPYSYEILSLHEKEGYIGKVVKIHSDDKHKNHSERIKIGKIGRVIAVHPLYHQWSRIKDVIYA